SASGALDPLLSGCIIAPTMYVASRSNRVACVSAFISGLPARFSPVSAPSARMQASYRLDACHPNGCYKGHRGAKRGKGVAGPTIPGLIWLYLGARRGITLSKSEDDPAY